MINDLDLWLKHDRHTFLVPARSKTDVVALFHDIRSGVEDLPETRAMFRLSDVMDHHLPGDVTQYTVGLVTLLGSWRVNEVYCSQSPTSYYVNPAHPDRARYSDVITRCECGSVFKQVGWPTHGTSQNHKPDCLYHHKMRTIATIWERRYYVLRETLLMARPANAAADRLGVSGNRVSEIAAQLGIDAEAMRNRGRELRAETMWHLLHEHPPEVVGGIYGVSGQTAKRQVRKFTEHSGLEAARERTGRDIQLPT